MEILLNVVTLSAAIKKEDWVIWNNPKPRRNYDETKFA